MQCEKCGSKTEVISSRPNNTEDTITRRRRCMECKLRFSTVEVRVSSFSTMTEAISQRVRQDIAKQILRGLE